MKSIEVKLSNDQCEALEQISKLCKKDAPDFIKEALICLFPLNEYVEIKRNLVKLQDETCVDENQDAFTEMSNQIREVNSSLSERLRRLGFFNN